jgi:basic membrane protein A
MGGMSVPAVEKYGFGYVSGIIDAAAELKLTSKIAIQYDYAGTFSPSDTIVTNTTSWYNAGTEAIFSCGGSIFKSISAAAIATSKKVIGVDVDQYSQAPSVVITSAEKKLQASTEAALDAFYKNNKAWPTDYAGKTALVGAKEGMVGIPTTDASWKFTTFTKTDYQTIFDKLVASATYTGVTYDSTNGVKLAANHTATDYVTITYGSGVTNKPVAIA